MVISVTPWNPSLAIVYEHSTYGTPSMKTTGSHARSISALGSYASGRGFPVDGDEAWVANALGHSLTVIPGLGGADEGASLERTDRGFYHYLIKYV